MNLLDAKSFLLDGLAPLSEEAMATISGGYGGGQSSGFVPRERSCPVCGSWPILMCRCNQGYGR